MELPEINIDTYDDVWKFLDLFENKGVYKISIEANQIPSPYRRIRPGLTYRSQSLAGMFSEAITLFKKNPYTYGDDLRQVIRALKTHGVLEESEGLPRKYDDCLKKYNKNLKEYEELKKDHDELTERSEIVLKEKEELAKEVKELRLENNKLKMQVEGK